MTVVPFDPTAFRAVFPPFATLSDPQLNFAFNQATLYLANTDCSVVPADPVTYEPRQTLLWLLVANIAAVTYGINGSPPSGIVGRISQATEGSVSVSAELSGADNIPAFYSQTEYGLLYWQATVQYRSAIYVPGPQPHYAQQFAPFGRRW